MLYFKYGDIMKIKANGYKIKINLIPSFIMLIISSFFSIFIMFFEFDIIILIFYLIMFIWFLDDVKIYNNCFIIFHDNYLEISYIKQKRKYRNYDSKLKSYSLKYKEIKEWGNIKNLSQKIHNARVYDIGFITKDNKKYFIYTNEYTLKELQLIIENLQIKINIKPNNEIILDKNTYKTI